MLERISVPRRALDFEDYIDILRRNIRWLIAPAFLGLVISTVVAYFMQDTYRSSALIRIVPQQIPDSLVQNATSQQLEDHINAMAESILSRNTLSNMITTYHLYKNELKDEPLEDVVNKMKGAVSIRPTEGVANVTERRLPAMRISFTYRDPHVAKAVCDDIVSRFMSQNVQESLEAHQSANEFLTDEFANAKRRMDELDQKLADFRTRNAGRLPEEMQLNIEQMNALTGRAGSLNDAANRNNEQRMMLENEMRTAKDRMASLKEVTPQTQIRNARVMDLDRQIQNLQLQIAAMKDRYTDDFPDLQGAKAQLALLQRERDQAAKETPKPDPILSDNPGFTRERLEAEAQIRSLETQMKANSMEADLIQKEIAQTNAAIASYQTRLEGVPAGEKEYLELMNDREIARQHYADLESKRERTVISMDLEKRKQGETLEILDNASLPVSPEAPKRPTIIAIGPGIGIAIGLLLVAVREVKDTSLKNLKDARLYTQLSVLGSIPLLENDLVVQRRKQMIWVGWATATLAGLAIMAVSVAHYYLNKA